MSRYADYVGRISRKSCSLIFLSHASLHLPFLPTSRFLSPRVNQSSFLASPLIEDFLFELAKMATIGADIIAQSDDSKICVVMVGLPARGKSLIAGKGMYQSHVPHEPPDANASQL